LEKEKKFNKIKATMRIDRWFRVKIAFIITRKEII